MDEASGRGARFREILRQAGPYYFGLYVFERLLHRVILVLQIGRVGVERRKRLVAQWTASAERFTVAENRKWWNRHDWSRGGEEWTPSDEWKQKIVERFLIPNVPERGAIVEIGPGGGRWTEFLKQRAATLLVIDVSERALDLCRARFGDSSNIQYSLVDAPKIEMPDASVDAIWSYDVFVHINPVDTASYFHEFRRVLKPGGRAVIHHPGAPPAGGGPAPSTRSDLTDAMVRQFARENDLALIVHTEELVNQGDMLSVFERR